MSPLHHVRKTVLGVSQAEFATIAGVSQGTVSKWEAGGLDPDREELSRIRRAIIDRGIEWDDRWFFELPTAGVAQ